MILTVIVTTFLGDLFEFLAREFFQGTTPCTLVSKGIFRLIPQVPRNTVRHLDLVQCTFPLTTTVRGKSHIFFQYSACLIRVAGVAILIICVPPIPLPARPCMTTRDAEIGLSLYLQISYHYCCFGLEGNFVFLGKQTDVITTIKTCAGTKVLFATSDLLSLTVNILY